MRNMSPLCTLQDNLSHHALKRDLQTSEATDRPYLYKLPIVSATRFYPMSPGTSLLFLTFLCSAASGRTRLCHFARLSGCR